MTKYKIIPSSRTTVQLPISIGHKAEKGVEAIEFDVTAWVETYGSGTLTVIMRRWGDAIPYPIALEIDENNKATWTLSDTDTARAGMAYAQLSYIVGETVVKKSDIYTFRVMDSLTGEGDPPEAYESWLEHLTHLAAEAMAEVLDIEGVATDKTLTVDGGVADAKATGEALAEKVDAADYNELSARVGANTIALAEKADRSTTYTKTEVDQMIEDVEVETDTTLEIAGAPADAKKVGDELSDIKADLGGLDDAVNGSTTANYTEGKGLSASSASHTIVDDANCSLSDFIPVAENTGVKFTYTDDDTDSTIYQLWVYDSSKEFIGYYGRNTTGINYRVLTTKAGTAYARFTFKRGFAGTLINSGSTVTYYEAAQTAVSGLVEKVGNLSSLETESKSNLVSAVNEVNKKLEHTIFDTILLESGSYSDVDGTTKTVNEYRLRNTRPFLVDDIRSITLPSGYGMWIFRLDKSFGLISAVGSWKSGTINISDIFVSGMKYITFAIYNPVTPSADISGQCQTVQDGMQYEKLSDSNTRDIDDIKNILIDGYIDYNDALVQGSYNSSGNVIARANRIRLPEFVFVPAGTSITINPGSLKKAYAIWKGSISASTIVKSTSFTDGTEEISIGDDGYFMTAFSKSDDSNISPSEFDGAICIKDSLPYRNKVAISRVGRNYTLPDYYMVDDYILNKINRINALGKESDDVFIFITDIHWSRNAKQSPALINYIMRRCGISKVFDGGDFADAVDKTALDIYKDAVIGEIHHATGNHDWFSPETGKSLYYAFDYDKNNQYGVFDKHYYYYDNVQAKIRYVVLNPFINTISTGWDIEYKADQITWLRDTALNVPDGYDVVIITHYYATNSSSITGMTAIESIINTFNGSGDGKVLFVCEGHRHWDAVFTSGSEVPIVLTTCDKYDVSNEPTLSGYVREKGTISEQAFDVVFINRDTHTATFVRIGAKAMDNNNISIGETGFTLEGTLEERTITIP